jgi:type II secretory pathway pseudopilin PulG
VIEVLVAVVLISVCMIGLAQFFASAGDRVMDSETRSLLHTIAAQEMEDIRALPYEDIGTVGGNPHGSLPDVETKTVDGIPVEITREVVFVKDDSYSGPYPANYRRVTIIVKATDSDQLDPMQLTSYIAGGAEGGTLDITVTNLAGEPVSNALLQINDEHLVPHVHIQSSAIRTDSQGHLLVPGLKPDSTNGYFITATKTGYNSATTPEGLVVNKGAPFTVVNLTIDELSTLVLHITDSSGAPRSGLALIVDGHLSVDPWTSSQVVTTDENGSVSLPNIRYGTSLQPYVVRTQDTYNPVLQLPTGTDPDPIDPGITLESGQIGLILDPGITRTVELVLP